MTFRRFGFLALALMGLAATVSSAHATVITPGSTVAPSAGSAPATAAIAGPTTTTMTFMSGGATYNLELTSAVYRESVLVPNGLTFAWTLKVLSSSPLGETINALAFQDFSSAAGIGNASVEYVGAVTPSAASWSGSGLSLTFTFNPAIKAGESSALLLFHTRATQYTAGNALAQGGAQYVSSTFAAAVPEPTSMVLAFVGLPLLGLYSLRRRARA